ncbi:putative DNA-directed RNA polymerase III subunit RPC4-like [Apostichopus japonicus]|uniref:Putative DNA-directed RNA polymerase III subunit RPC4-like n=1 Tax=Stichopus japonicus TaxID=307972 RepID=A0A2G8LG37_STIJA|nr:putative DNA-directed RNA polymerase III subunit RPC4-like [Apostichopus japonicus]
MAENSQTPNSANASNQDGVQKSSLGGRRRDLMSSSARLPSIRTPRDLYLKGNNKKTFKPNIPARRERTKEDGDGSSKSSSPGPSKRARGRGRGRGGSRGRGRGGRNRNQDLIQTHSIFEDGPGEKLVRRSTTEGFGRSGSSSFSKDDLTSSSSLASSFRSLKLKRSERLKEDSKNIAELLRDDFLKDASLAVDEKFKPVCLPLKLASKSSSSSSSNGSLQDITDDAEPSKVKVKTEPPSPEATVKVKQEPPDSDEEMKSIDSKDSLMSRLATSTKSPEAEKTSLPLFSRRDHLEGKLLFFQLPDSLPALAPSSDDDRSRVMAHEGQGTSRQSNATGDQPDDAENANAECTLEDLPAGFLGKLRIRKSGKMEMKLGNITLDVSVGTPCGFLQDIVSIRKAQDQQEIVNLGQIKHRIICTPNLQSLLEKR